MSDDLSIYLFEHDKNSTDFRLVKSHEGQSINQANYYCGTDVIVSTYLYKGPAHNRAGVSILELNENKATDYNMRDGSGDFLRYKNGILFNSQLVHVEPVEPSLGYMARNEYASWKNGAQLMIPQHTFTYMHYFDFGKRTVTNSYRHDLLRHQWIRGGYMYAELYGVFVRINLANGYREMLFDFEQHNAPVGALVMTHDDLYLFTRPDSWNVEYNRYKKELIGYEANTLYKMIDGQLQKQMTMQYPDPVYVLSKNEDIYIFTQKSHKVIKFDGATKKCSEYDFDTGDKSIIAVNYTDNNFIIVVEMNHRKHGIGVILASNDFSRVGKLHELKNMSASMTDITTNQNEHEGIQYSFHRL